jgi:integrase
VSGSIKFKSYKAFFKLAAKGLKSQSWLIARGDIFRVDHSDASGNSQRFRDVDTFLHRHLKPAGQKIGTPWLNWHTLRRTHATLLQAAGASLRDAQVQLGHSKMSTTLEVYTVPIPAHLREAVENLSQLVTNGDEFGQIAEGVPSTIQ